MTDVDPETGDQKLNQDDLFEIGGEDIPADADGLAEIQIRIGTLLKIENVSFLLGAGASVDSGGITIRSIPLPVERTLIEAGMMGRVRPRIRRWLKIFYIAGRSATGADVVPIARHEIMARRDQIVGGDASVEPLPVNLEQVLSTLHRWRSVVPRNADRLRLEGTVEANFRRQELDDCLAQATRALAGHCILPKDGCEAGLSAYKILVRKVLTRPLNLKRVNIFTLNYDTLVEQAADAEGVVLRDGFVGTNCRIFRPESYEQDLYFPAETTEGRVHRFDRVLHLYKLHGSITWLAEPSTLDNPYGVATSSFDEREACRLLIYPTPAKVAETLGMPYAEIFRRFATSVARPQSVLFIVGYGFGDEHVNAIIRQALAVPSFTLVIVDPKPSSGVVETLRKQADRRVWIVRGRQFGTFAGFVNRVLPELLDEEIRKKVMETHAALGHRPSPGDGTNGD